MTSRAILVICLASAFLAGCGYTPRDQNLVEQYYAKRSALEHLSIVVRNLPEGLLVSHEFISPAGPNDAAGARDVRRLLRDVGAESAVLWKNGQVMIRTGSIGSKGFARISAPLPEYLKSSLRTRLDRPSDLQRSDSGAPGAGIYLRHIEGEWYVFLIHD
jgi:hypothetical protein